MAKDGGFGVDEGGTKQPLIAFSHAIRRSLALAQEGADVSNFKMVCMSIRTAENDRIPDG